MSWVSETASTMIPLHEHLENYWKMYFPSREKRVERMDVAR